MNTVRGLNTLGCQGESKSSSLRVMPSHNQISSDLDMNLACL